MSIVSALRGDVLDDNTSMSVCLRKAKVLATELDHEGFEAWVNSELFGYRDETKIPNYRRYQTHSYGTFAGPFQSQISNYILPVFNLDDSLRKFATTIALAQSIGELEALSKKGQDVSEPWPAEAVMFARGKINITDGYELIAARKPIPCYVFDGVVETIRNKLLEFVLELQKVSPGVLETDTATSQIPTETVSNIFFTTISGGQNVIASGSGFLQKVTQTVAPGDMEGLAKYLRSLGITKEDIALLRRAIEQDGTPPEESLGKNVKSWMMRMTKRAIDGLLKVAVEVAIPLIVKAIKQYYGWA